MSEGSQSLHVARLGEEPNQANMEHILTPMLEADRPLFYAFMQVDMAHTVMLAEQGILTVTQAGEILRVLREIDELGVERFPVDPRYDTFLLQVERYMIERIGEDVAGRMHTGRSRNDQGATVDRIYSRDRLLDIYGHLLGLQDSVLELAREHVETLMPGYTHLQHAQPTTFGHYLMRHYYTFERSQQRLRGAYARTNLNALGGAAMAGTSWPLDRRRTAELLGHEGLVMNSSDTGAFDTDFPTENAAVLAILMSDLGRLATDLYVWSTWEFRMVEIADGLAGTSSIMPQKKNPHALERIRALSGLSVGWVPAHLGTLRSTSSSDLGMAFAGEQMPHMASSTASAIELLRVTLGSLTVNTDVMRQRAGVFWSTTSNLADELVRHAGISFRTAHHVVGRVVRNAIRDDVPPTGVTGEMVDRAATETIGRPLDLPADIIRRALDPEAFIRTRITEGSVNPDAVAATIEDGSERQAGHREWHERKRRLLDDARHRLREAAMRYVDSTNDGA
jgi:argininosuccinate lyase